MIYRSQLRVLLPTVLSILAAGLIILYYTSNSRPLAGTLYSTRTTAKVFVPQNSDALWKNLLKNTKSHENNQIDENVSIKLLKDTAEKSTSILKDGRTSIDIDGTSKLGDTSASVTHTDKLTGTIPVHMSTTTRPLVLPAGHYVVFGCSSPVNKDYNYVFMLPLTVHAWMRIGYESIVLLTGQRSLWSTDSVLDVVVQELNDIGAHIVYIETPLNHAIMISQTGRLFVSRLVGFTDPEHSTITTSDSDLWPIMHGAYDIPPGKLITSLNSECCGNIERHGMKFKMLPMSNVAMSVTTWADVINIADSPSLSTSGTDVSTSSFGAMDILQYFFDEYGDVAYSSVSKGENQGWYLDQLMISLRVRQWADRQDDGHERIHYMGRNTGRDRVDRSFWSVPRTLDGKIDAHLLEHAYQPEQWLRLMSLAKLMFSNDKIDLITKYRTRFVQQLQTTNR